MALIYREEGGVQSPLYRVAIRTLVDKLREGNCLIFLGAGASLEDPPPAIQPPDGDEEPDPPAAAALNPAPRVVPDPERRPPRMPDGRQLAKELMAKCGITEEKPLPAAASTYEFLQGRAGLNQELVRLIGNPDIPPSRSIRQLVDVLYTCPRGITTLAVTTNYDRHFERAYRAKFGRAPKVAIYKGATDPRQAGELNAFPILPDEDAEPMQDEDEGPHWQPKPGCTLYKLHGCIRQPRDPLLGDRGLVVTEEDYVNFVCNAMAGAPADDKGILGALKGRLEYSTILFLGYSLSDFNFRALYKVTAERRNRKPKSYAIQFRDPAAPVTAASTIYWNQLASYWDSRGTDIINARASEFTWDLLAGAQTAAREAAA